MATLTQRRNARLRLDQNTSRAAHPIVRAVLVREGKRIRAATRNLDTPAAWLAAAQKAVSDKDWERAMIQIWTGKAAEQIWKAQQDALGTDYPMDRKVLTAYAVERGRIVAQGRRDNLARMVERATDDG